MRNILAGETPARGTEKHRLVLSEVEAPRLVQSEAEALTSR